MITIQNPLTEEQIHQYHRDGYCVVDDLFSEKELQEIEVFFEDYKVRGGKAFEGGVPYTEIDPGQRQVRAMQPHHYSKKAEAWLIKPNVAAVLTTLLEHEPLGAQTMYYYKPPGAKGQGMHQDDFYLLTKNLIPALRLGRLSTQRMKTTAVSGSLPAHTATISSVRKMARNVG